MATKYCVNCDRVVEAKRVIGIGTFILAILSGGLWLLLIPFYSKRCPICKGTNFGKKPVNKVEAEAKSSESQNAVKEDPLEKIKKLQALKDSGAITTEEFNDMKTKILAAI